MRKPGQPRNAPARFHCRGASSFWLGRAGALGLLARSVADEAELLLIAVRPDSQRSGAGKTLVGKIVSNYASKAIKKIHLEVRTDNPALAFYGRLGFVQSGLRRNYYRRSDSQFTGAATLSLEIV